MIAAAASKIGARGSANVRRGWDGERGCVFIFLSDTAWEVLDVEELKNAGAYRSNSELPDTELELRCQERKRRFGFGMSYYMTSQSHILLRIYGFVRRLWT
jgi:hypothetical protein